jgi:hypothetical protein
MSSAEAASQDAARGQATATRFDVGRLSDLVSSRLVWILPPGAAAIVLWVISPRFALSKPSLIDDWYAITYGPAGFHGLVHAHYDAAAVDLGGRFRPSYVIWNYLQWHWWSGSSLVAPEIWGAGRVLVLLVAVGAITYALTRGRVSRGWSIGLGTAAGLSLALTPQTAVDLARFGPAEPLALGTLACGGLLVTIGLRRFLSGARRGVVSGLAAGGGLAVGYALWVFGAYLWEASAGLLVLLPFLYLGLVRDPELGRPRLRSTVGVAVLLLAVPLTHQAVNLVLAMEARTAYVSEGGGLQSFAQRLGVASLITVIGMAIALGTPVWLGAFLLTVRGLLDRARNDRSSLVCLGALGGGAVCVLIGQFAAAGPSRYFLPWAAAVAIGGATLLTQLGARARVLVIALMFALLLIGGPRSRVQAWVTQERSGAAAIDLAAGMTRGSCTLYLSNFSHERRLALARLARYGDAADQRDCATASRAAYTLNWGVEGAAPRFPGGCRSRWYQVAAQREIGLFACDRFHAKATTPDQDVNLGNEVVSVVRFVPSRRLVPASDLLTVGASAK